MPAFWGVVRSLPKKEVFAAERLRMDHGYEVFLPLVQNKRGPQPLFASYFFCRIELEWRAINRTFGVLCLVRVGDSPAGCPDQEIEILKNMTDSCGFVRLPDRSSKPSGHVFKKGAPVKIIGGAFQGVTALHSGMSASEKEILLIAMLGASRRIAISSHLVAAQ
jgi:transcription antitermination factor NusG